MATEIKKVTGAANNVALSPLKMRLVADLIRGKSGEKAEDILKFLNKKGASIMLKALKSTIASAKEIHGATKENVIISYIAVDEGKKFRGVRFESRGRVSRLTKRRSNINIELTVK